jgi:hypothetical protein
LKINKHEDKELHVFMARNKDSKSGKDDQYIVLGASRHFTNNIECYIDFVEDEFQSDSVMLSHREEYNVRVKGNVLLQLRGDKVMIKDVYNVHCLKQNLLSISSIMKHIPHSDTNFSNNKCFIVD